MTTLNNHFQLIYSFKVVGLSGLEPLTSRLSGVRSNQLSYRPLFNYQSSTQEQIATPLSVFFIQNQKEQDYRYPLTRL